MPLAKDIDVKKIAKEAGKVSGAVIEGICQKAGLYALRRKKKNSKLEVTKNDFENALKSIKK